MNRELIKALIFSKRKVTRSLHTRGSLAIESFTFFYRNEKRIVRIVTNWDNAERLSRKLESNIPEHLQLEVLDFLKTELTETKLFKLYETVMKNDLLHSISSQRGLIYSIRYNGERYYLTKNGKDIESNVPANIYAKLHKSLKR